MTGTEALIIGSTVLGAFQQVQQGKSQQAFANYNAQLAEQEAVRQRQIAALDEERFRRQAEKEQGQRRVALAAAGVDPSQGTSLDLLGEAASDAELDALLIRYGGAVGAAQQINQANADRFGGRIARNTGFAKAGSTILGGGIRLLGEK